MHGTLDNRLSYQSKHQFNSATTQFHSQAII
jgi:hypothetical protein